jgi:hypothetical protein
MKKVFIQPMTFGDIEESTWFKMALLHWGEIFKNINREEYPEYILDSDPDERALDD